MLKLLFVRSCVSFTVVCMKYETFGLNKHFTFFITKYIGVFTKSNVILHLMIMAACGLSVSQFPDQNICYYLTEQKEADNFLNARNIHICMICVLLVRFVCVYV